MVVSVLEEIFVEIFKIYLTVSQLEIIIKQEVSETEEHGGGINVKITRAKREK